MERIGNHLAKILQELGVTLQLKAEQIRELWPTIVGEKLAEGTEIIGISRKTLFIGVKNASKRAYLSTRKTDIIEKLRKVGFDGIEDIKFVRERPRK